MPGGKDSSRNSSSCEERDHPLPPRKKRWWQKLVPSCGAGQKKNNSTNVQQGQVLAVANTGAGLVTCASCGASEQQGGPPAFVCTNCSKVNRVIIEGAAGDPVNNTQRRVSVCSDLTEEQKNRLVRTGSSTFEPMSGDAHAKEAEVAVPQCQVCMDGPGDMVLLPCGHGAICEACAKHIAKNMSVGGNHCVRCRSEIKKLVRLDQLYKDQATGVTVIIPETELRKGPPKVPPPPGLNKSKQPSKN